MENSVLISVIIPAFNSERTIGLTISSVLSSSLPRNLFEVIVVDNGSVDNTVEVAKRFPVRLYSCPIRGQAPARNVGLREARGSIICFTDSDVVVPKDWLEKISNFLRDHPEIDGVGGRVLNPVKGHVNEFQKWVGDVYYEDQTFPRRIEKSRVLSYTASLYSADCSYRRDVLLSVNGFDESVWDGNDIDLTWRLVRQGKTLVFNPNIEVVHLGFASTLGKVFQKQMHWGKIYSNLMWLHSPHYAKRVFKMLAFSCFRITRDIGAVFSPNNFFNRKVKIRMIMHVAFDLGRLFELLVPHKTIKRMKIDNTMQESHGGVRKQ